VPGFFELLVSLLTASGLSGLIGLEREIRIQTKKLDGSHFGGVRTYSMIGALGFLGTILSLHFHIPWMLPVLFVSTLIFLFISHALVAALEKRFGITSQLSLIASFLIGVFVAQKAILFAITISILFTSLLVLKIYIHNIAKKINQKEMLAILQFFILSAIILPLLPQHYIDPFNFFDWQPRILWLMVILVASIRFIGYFLSKFFGNEKSILLSGIIGGFVSSTAVTMGISQESKGKKHIPLFLIPILLASALMFFRVLLEVSIATSGNMELLLSLISILGSIGVVSIIFALFLLYKRPKGKEMKANIHIDQPLKIKSALSFGIFFLAILLLSDKISDYFSESGLFIASAISAITDVDAITLAITNLWKNNEISTEIASQIILLAVSVNTFVKVGIVFLFGSRHLFWATLFSVLGIFLLGGSIFLIT
jgi:uncharacterized membrane protein (DUF4010 family)